ncbi:MAG: sugar transferase [Anaerovoracaceae bacterium]
MKSWKDLPETMQGSAVRPYYDYLARKKGSLVAKRVFDLLVSGIMIIILSPLLLFLTLWVKIDSPGPAMFRQVRVTQYGKEFRIFKFRTMVVNAEALGAQVTGSCDPRITSVGNKLRKVRLDELPQLLNIFLGEMSFVGTRPEVPRYVERYTEEMRATLLLPAGVTSIASIAFKDEDEIMADAENPDELYVHEVLPIKMRYNLQSLKEFGFWKDIATMFKTVAAVIK